MVVTKVRHQALTKRHIGDHIGTQVWINIAYFLTEKVTKKKKRKIFAHTFTKRNAEMQIYQISGGEETIMSFVTSLC